MKHLLTALFAALFLVLPLHAEEPTEMISLRVIDHEGEPISGLALKAKVGSARADAVTDESGIASFTVPEQPDADSVWIWPFDSSFTPLTRARVDAAQPEPDLTAFSSYAFDRATRFDLDELAEDPFTMRTPESVQCMVRLYVVGISAKALDIEALQCRGGPNMRWSRPGLGLYFGSDESGPYLRSFLPIARHQPAQIAAFAQGRFHLVELDEEQTKQGLVRVEVESVDPLPSTHHAVPSGEILCPLEDDSAVIRFCLIPVDGDHAREVWLRRERLPTKSGRIPHPQARATVPSGDFLILPRNRNGMYWERDAFGPDFWSPGSVFDTMLRLRRGEDLPHLKRITIPEGGTVELSTEDFLDPPTEPEAEDATP